MTKVKYYINVDTPHVLNNEQKMEILADIRNAIRNVKFNLPDIKVIVGRELTNDDIMESLRETPKHDLVIGSNASKCVHYDEAQGRHKCVNPLLKNKKCVGVCLDYEEENNS